MLNAWTLYNSLFSPKEPRDTACIVCMGAGKVSTGESRRGGESASGVQACLVRIPDWMKSSTFNGVQ